MPQNKFALARYRLIDLMLRRSNYVKSSSIIEKCFEQTGFRVSRRTIQLDIEAMRFDSFLGYNAPIGYCPRRKAYYYEDPAYCFNPFPFTPQEIAALQWLLNLCIEMKREDCCDVLRRLVTMAK
ncbi:MAG: hypothetical protein LBM20_01295 [Rikenellaceae bacterium]|jgi:predicted DNA-binding transcriptional regulator YafY|nr:hypothetical protein [Rikenellaceae bacterium]